MFYQVSVILLDYPPFTACIVLLQTFIYLNISVVKNRLAEVHFSLPEAPIMFCLQ